MSKTAETDDETAYYASLVDPAAAVASPSRIVTGECSGECRAPFRLDTGTLVVTMNVPSNGRRGQFHVPAHRLTADATVYDGLILWECPRCGYADSEEEVQPT